MSGELRYDQIYDQLARLNDESQTGFIQWNATGPYYQIIGGAFQLLVSGYGRIKGLKVSWAAPQTTAVLVANTTSYVYIDPNGLIQITTTADTTLYDSNIVLFEVLYDGTNYNVVKESHPFDFNVHSSRYMHENIGTIIKATTTGLPIGANLTQITTGTGAVVTDRQIKIVGAALLEDHGLITTIPDSAGVAVTWNFYYTNAAGKWIRYAQQTSFPMVYNNGGTITSLATSGGSSFGVFRCYVSKDNWNTLTPNYYAVINTSAFNNIGAVNTAIGSDNVAIATNELYNIEFAQLGFVTVTNNVSGGYINNVTLQKSLLSTQFAQGGNTASAALTLLNTPNFLGTILDSTDTNVQLATEDIDNHVTGIYNITSEPTGMVNRTDSTISFVNATRIFTISPVGASFEHRIKGKQYIVTSPQSVTISNVSGTHYIYFDVDGILKETATIPPATLFSGLTYVCAIYWSVGQAKGVYVADERHGLTMDWATHNYLHFSFGAQYISGLALGNFVIDGDGSLNTQSQCSCSDGVIKDEDLEHSITNAVTQTLSPTLNAPVFYRIGSAGEWYSKDASPYSFVYSGDATGYTDLTNGLPAYNQYTGTTWQLSPVANGDYFLVHILATNYINNNIIALVGQNIYTTKGSARTGAVTELSSITGLPFQEMTPIGTIIAQANKTYTNLTKTTFVSTADGSTYVDFRKKTFSTSSGATSTSTGGIYVPIITVPTNCTIGTIYNFRWSQIGNIVDVKGVITVSTTGAIAGATFEVSLPIASNLTTANDNSGGISSSNTLFTGGMLLGNITNETMVATFNTSAAMTNGLLSVAFSYIRA